MSRHKAFVSVAQMADAMEAAIEYVGKQSRESLEADAMRRDAVMQRLQVVGEAARRVPMEVVKAHPEVDWGGWIGLRNRITHGYDTINYGLVWSIVTQDLPQALPALRALQGILREKGT